MNNDNQLKTGGDPRALPDYAALRNELAKLNHPARPDVNWGLVEQLSLSLFRQNGVELQTAAWYTLARTRLAGMAGLNEGLAILEALISHQWGALWPQPVHARVEILAGLSQRLQSTLRTFTLRYAELSLVYRAEHHLNALNDALQRLELKNVSQMGALGTLMHNAAIRLENRDMESDASVAVALPLPPRGLGEAVSGTETSICVARQGSVASHRMNPPAGRALPWKSFTAGMLTMLVLSAAGLWGWRKINPPLAIPLPVVANAGALKALAQLPPLWRQDYGFQLAGRAETAEADKLKTQWQNTLAGNALSPEALSGWHQGMEGLNEMARRLNALDERKGKYLTGSELKSMVFTITHNFARARPVEERLYLLSQADAGAPLPAGEVLQIDMQLNQLLNRYALLRQASSSVVALGQPY